MPDLNTPKKGYPLPHADNTLIRDVQRLTTALTMIDTDNDKVVQRLNHVRLNTLLNDNLFLI